MKLAREQGVANLKDVAYGEYGPGEELPVDYEVNFCKMPAGSRVRGFPLAKEHEQRLGVLQPRNDEKHRYSTKFGAPTARNDEKHRYSRHWRHNWAFCSRVTMKNIVTAQNLACRPPVTMKNIVTAAIGGTIGHFAAA